jgi:flavorubredoxin
MAKILIIYESRYGNTRLVADTIAEGMAEVAGVETTVSEVKEVDLNQIHAHDAVLIGSPNHIGRATRSIRKLIDSLDELNNDEKPVAFFDTYLGSDYEKAVKKMANQIAKKAPSWNLVASGLSVRVDKAKGPVTDGELPRCREFGVRIANLISDRPKS